MLFSLLCSAKKLGTHLAHFSFLFMGNRRILFQEKYPQNKMCHRKITPTFLDDPSPGGKKQFLPEK